MNTKSTTAKTFPQRTGRGIKGLRKIVLIFSAALLFNQSLKAQCTAAYTYTASSQSVTFTNTSTFTQGANPEFIWNFGDGYVDYTTSPVHKFKPGKHYVCLHLIDSAHNCNSHFCDSIYVGGCLAAFTESISGTTVTFTNRSNTSTSPTYLWDFGDGSATSTQANPVHDFGTAGRYTVTMVKSDAVEGCADTTQQVLYIYVGCHAGWNYSAYGKTIYVYGDSVGNSAGANFNWDFGDGTTVSGTNKYAQHIYSADGSYRVRLTVDGGSTCMDSASKLVNISTPAPTYSIYGRIYLGDSMHSSDHAMIYLIQLNPADSSLSVIDTVSADTVNFYYFFRLQAGTYYVKAALKPASAHYNDYLPAYYTTELQWMNATPIVISSYSMPADVLLIAGSNPGGPGFIGGKVSQGANKKEGDPLKDIEVILMDNNHHPIASTWSDADGNYNFSNLALGTYEVFAEIPGLKPYPGNVTLTADKPTANNVEIKVNSSSVATSIRTAVNNELAASVNVYPNPASDHINVSIKAQTSLSLKVGIYDYTGKQLMSRNVTVNPGDGNLDFSTSELSKGLYTIKLMDTNSQKESVFSFSKAE
jgi:PKD repeat protein